jgi:hypothetical protein
MFRRIFVALSVMLLTSTMSQAANTKLSSLSAAGAISGANLFYAVQTPGSGGVAATATQVGAYIYGLMSGDATASGTGAVTFATVNSNVGSFGSATNCVTLTVNGKGLITAASAATCTPAIGSVTGLATGIATFLGTPSSANLLAALTTKTGTGNAVFGSSPTIDSLSATTAMTLSFITGSTQCLQVSTSGAVSGTGATCGGGSGSVTSITPGAALVSSTTSGASQSAITTTGTLSGAEIVNAQTSTTYAIQDSDRGKLVTYTSASNGAWTLAQAGASTTFQSAWYSRIQNKGTGPLVITPTTSTICGGSTITIFPGQTEKITSDGTNYQCDGGMSGTVTTSPQSGSNYPFVSSNFGQLVNLSNASAQIPTIPQAGTAGFPAGWYVEACNQGAGIQTITPTTSTIGGAATYLLLAGSAAHPVCVSIVSDGTNYQVVPDSPTISVGTAALGTTSISAGTCGTATTVSAPGVSTSDVITVAFNGDPTAVTGYTPSAMLTIVPYPTANNVNFKQCNLTSSSITPSALTVNWRVAR